MINNRSLLIVGGLAAVAWLASNSLYVVDETERAVKLRFGEVIEENIQPGLHVKIPIAQTIRMGAPPAGHRAANGRCPANGRTVELW